MFNEMDDAVPSAQDDAVDAPATDNNNDAGPSKKKRRKKPKGQQLSAMSFEASRQFAATIAQCSPAEQADWLWNDKNRHDKSNTGTLAKEESGLVESSLVQLPQNQFISQQLKSVVPNWQSELCGVNTYSPGRSTTATGSPSVLVVSSAAMGAIAFIKSCQEFNAKCKIGKLFAKHIKVEEQQDILKSTFMGIAAGTPNRIVKLADLGALKLDRLKLVLLDVQLDAKQRTILDIPEVRADWWLLFDKHLKQQISAGKTKVALFKIS